MPFAIIGSDREVAVGGKKILGRQTKWGFIEVDNKKHCEFSLLRDMLIKWVGGSLSLQWSEPKISHTACKVGLDNFLCYNMDYVMGV